MSEEKKLEILNEDIVMERGIFKANNHTFIVKPIYLGEESQYLAEMKISPVPNLADEDKSVEDLTDKELGSWAIAMFSQAINQTDVKNTKTKRLLSRLSRLFCHKNYHYYDNMPVVQPIIKWIEKKVTYNGHKIRFYDLERKYGLNKTEIEKLFIYFHEISGF